MRTNEEILKDEKNLIKYTRYNCLPIHTEILLDIRDLLTKLVGNEK